MAKHDRKNLISMIARLRGCLYSVKHNLDGLHDEEETEALRAEIEMLLTMTRLDALDDEDLTEDGVFARDWEERAWLCAECLQPQHKSHHGLVCEQGHGGAPSLDASYPVRIHDDYNASVETIRIELDFEALQELVGGHVEIVSIDDEWAMVVDEDAKMKRYPVNHLASMRVREVHGTDVCGPAVLIRKKQLRELL